MKNTTYFAATFLSLLAIKTFCPNHSQASATQARPENCFVLAELNSKKIIKKEGDCETPSSPNSTFKIALSVMGFDSGILKTENTPEWPYQEGYPSFLEVWKEPHTPAKWIQNSCVWFSQVLTQKLGMKRFKNYVESFEYGNRDTSGDPGKDNGLTHSWLDSSLKISPIEEISFLQKLIKSELPVSLDAQMKTKNILFSEDLQNDWKLYGKTGTGEDQGLQRGWFVGWISKQDKKYVFAQRIFVEKGSDLPGGKQAKAKLKSNLHSLKDVISKP